MATLPTPEMLGERPTPQPSTSIAVPQTGFEAQATAELGQAIEQVGMTVQRARRAAQLTDAMGSATADLDQKVVAYERDQDFKTAPTRFKSDSKVISDTYAQKIDDPIVRDMFNRQFAVKAMSQQLVVTKAAARQEADYNVGQLDQREDLYVRQAVNSASPIEQNAVLNEARADLAVMRRAGWITDVDAAKRERSILGKVDQAIVIRDMSNDPIKTAQNLSLHADYAPNLDPLMRERLADQGFRRADAEQTRKEREADKDRKQQADDLMLSAFDMQAKGQPMNEDFISKARAIVSPSEYHSLLRMKSGEDVTRDNPTAFATLQVLAYDNPKEAETRALQYHRNGLIKNETLASVLQRARGIDRQDGPKSEYERSRQYITSALKPSDMVPDPAASARFAVAIREYDDFASVGKPADTDLRSKADDILKRVSLVDMTDMARRTSVEVRNDPKTQLDEIAKKATKLQADREANRITQQKFNTDSAKLNDAKKAAERALQFNGGK